MSAILGLALFGIMIMIALFLGQMLIYFIFGALALVWTAFAGALAAILNLFKGE